MPYKKLAATAASVAVCAAAVCIVAGCGEASSSTSSGTSEMTAPLTQAQLIATADPICAHYLTELHAHPLKKANEFSQELQRLYSNHQTELSELQKLRPPTALASDWAKIVGGHEALSHDMTEALRDAHAGELRAVTPLIISGSRRQAATLAIARRDGFKDCSRVR